MNLIVAATVMTAVAAFAIVAIGHRTSPNTCMSVYDETMSLEGGCAVDLPQLRIEAAGVVRLRQSGDALEMINGSALFAVTPVPSGHPPVRIRVSGGTIEVIGTRFRIHERQTGGTIELMEGTVRFIFPDGKVSVLHAGETLKWGVPENDDQPTAAGMHSGDPERQKLVPTPAVSAPDERNDRTTIEVEIDAVDAGGGPMGTDGIEDIEQGRVPTVTNIRRRFEALKRESPYTEAEHLRLQLEPVSFELGEAYEREHAPAARTCAHWRWHLQHFPSGIYNASIREKMIHLRCPGAGP
jgi:hypothetical protein